MGRAGSGGAPALRFGIGGGTPRRTGNGGGLVLGGPCEEDEGGPPWGEPAPELLPLLPGPPLPGGDDFVVGGGGAGLFEVATSRSYTSQRGGGGGGPRGSGTAISSLISSYMAPVSCCWFCGEDTPDEDPWAGEPRMGLELAYSSMGGVVFEDDGGGMSGCGGTAGFWCNLEAIRTSAPRLMTPAFG